MNIFNIDIPPLAVLIASLIGAFFIGLGMGLGTELGKYCVQKYLFKRLKFFVRHGRKVVKLLYKR